MSTEKDIKKFMREEYIRCATDPVHFMKKYCYIQHPQRGRILFHLYPFQEKTLRHFKGNAYSIILKSRQMGISTLTAGYSLWMMTFHDNKNILTLATTQATARNLVEKVRFMYDNLPSWLKVDAYEDNKLSLRLQNGSKITAKSSNADSARSEAVTLLIVDEAAFIDNIRDTWASAQQTLATGGGAIILSTPNGTGNWFHQTWQSAETRDNDFIPIKLKWDLHPERDQSWRDAQDNLLGDPRLAAQECDCDFATSGDTVFYIDFIEEYAKLHMKTPLERRGHDQNFWIWEPADHRKDYIVVADVARGDGKDYSAFHVIDIDSCEQVAEFKGQLSTTEFGHLLVRVGYEYNEALLVVENASIGWSTIQTIQEKEYRNLYYSPRGGQISADSYYDQYDPSSNMVAGFSMNSRTRPLAIGKFQEYFNDRTVIIRSKRLLDEMKVFVWKNGRAEAQGGYNDDLIMSFAAGLFVRDTAIQFRNNGIDQTKAALSNFKTANTPYSGIYSPTNMNVQNPYMIDNGKGGTEDFRWILG